MKRVTIALFAAAIMSTAAFAQEVPPLSDKLPENCPIYVGWGGMPASPATSQPTLLGNAKLKELADTMIAYVQTNTGQAQAQLLRQIVAASDSICPHKAAVAILDFTISDDSPEPQICIAIMLDAGNDKDAITAKIDDIISSLTVATKFKDETIEQVKVRKLELDKNMVICMGWSENIFTFAIGTPDKINLAFKKPGDNTLAKNANFAKTIKETSVGGELLTVYADGDMYKKMLTFDMSRSDKAMAKKLIPAMGLDKITSLAATAAIKDGMLVCKRKIFTPAPHNGILAPLAGKALSDDDLAIIPEDADFFLASNISPKEVFDQIYNIAAQVDESAPQQIDMTLAMAEQVCGISIKDDLIASLDSTIILSSAQSQGGPLTGTILTVKIKDTEKFNNALAAIHKVLAPLAQSAPVGRHGNPPPTFKQIECGKTTISTLAFGQNGLFLSPAWAVHDGRLIIAMYPQVIQTVIARMGTKPITKTPEFAKFRKQFSGNPIVLGYINTPSIARQIYPALLVGENILAMTIKQYTGSQIPSLIPSLDELESGLKPDGLAVSTDNDGIVIESSNNATAVISQAPVLVTGLMLALSQARKDARRAASASNLGSIAKGIALYKGEFNDKPPTSLGILVVKGTISPRAFVSPSGKTPVPKVDQATGDILGDIDYVYFEVLDSAPGDTLMAYEKPEFYDNTGTNILRANCSVEWVDMATFKKLMEESKKYHDEGAGQGYNCLLQH